MEDLDHPALIEEWKQNIDAYPYEKYLYKVTIDVDHLNTTYQDIITNFALNIILHHVGMICIIESHEQLQYDMDIQNSD